MPQTKLSARRSAALCLTALLAVSALAGCKGKDEADSAPAAPASPGASGASTPGTDPGASPGTAPGGPGGTMMNKPSENPAGAGGDALITGKVKSALIGDTKVAARDINVDTKSGTVVLGGKQATTEAKAAAIADAHKIEGVKNVIDHLTVKP